MALHTALYVSTLIPALALALSACGGDETPDQEGLGQSSAYESSDPGTGADRSDEGYAGGEAAENTASDTAGQYPATAAQTARGGDAVSVGGDTERGPAVDAVARRFDLTEADTIILPTLYRATADITSTRLTVDRSQGDLGYVTVTGSVDPDAVMRQPRDGLAFELTEDRVTEFLGEPVIVTLIARMGEDWSPDGQRPALRAAWVEPNGASSGWRTMNLAGDWRKAVFSYDSPTDTAGAHVLTIVPPSDQPVDIAAVAIRAQGAADIPDPGGSGGADQARPMRTEALPERSAPSADGGAAEDG